MSMIRYNFPYRGAYEYDKFILNYLQLSNAILFLEDDVLKEQSNALESLKETKNKVSEIYNQVTGEESTCHPYVLYLLSGGKS